MTFEMSLTALTTVETYHTRYRRQNYRQKQQHHLLDSNNINSTDMTDTRYVLNINTTTLATQ